MDDNETARYLASYILSNSYRVMHWSFDRNGSHSDGEYREYCELSQTGLEEVIKEFYANLL